MKLSERKLRNIIRSEISRLVENRVIGDFSRSIYIDVDVENTRHATQRQQRDGDYAYTTITDEEIVATAEEAIDQIIEKILVDEIDVNDPILIKDLQYDLNLVCTLVPKSKDGRHMSLKVITVMLKKNFRPSTPGTKVIEIY